MIAAILAAFALPAQAAQRHDVVVVLGAGAPIEGWANPVMLSRVCEGVLEYRAGAAPKLLMSGGYTAGHVAESQIMKVAAEAMGAPPSDIVVEDASVNTAENAAYSIGVMRDRGWRSALLVSSQGHLLRARTTFAVAGRGWLETLDAAAAGAALDARCVEPPAGMAVSPSAEFDLLIVDLTHVEPLAQTSPPRGEDAPPWLLERVRRAAAIFRGGRARRLYFVVPEPSPHLLTGDPATARVAAEALGVPVDLIWISSGRRMGEVPGAVEPASEPWLRIPGARLAVLAEPAAQSGWVSRLKSGMSAALPAPAFVWP